MIIAALVGLGLVVLGGSAQLGLWRSWTRRFSPGSIFSWWYLGVAVLAALLFGLTADAAAGVALSALGVALLGAALFVGMIVFGMPRFLMPRWYRSVRGVA